MDDSKKVRQAGRPRERSGVGRQGLIDATLVLLRTTSPEALGLVDIARAAGVDPALIRYYFGGKDGLLREATWYLLETTQLGERLPEHASVRELLRLRIQRIIQTGRDNPYFLPLVQRQIYQSVEQGGSLEQQAQEYLAISASRGTSLSERILAARDAQARPIDARYLHVALLGACTFFATAQPLFQVLFSADEPSPEEGYVDFLVELLARGIDG